MSENYIIHGEQIDQEFCDGMFAEYMQGEWGTRIGYNTRPLWYIGMRKELFDYQVLCSVGCNGELADASRGHITYTCCSSGSTLTVTEGPVKCCPEEYSIRNSDMMCVALPPNTDVISPIPCPCCPEGYTYNTGTGKCQGFNASDLTDPIDCPSYCYDGVGNRTAFVACTDRVPDSILQSAPTYGDNSSLCCETMVTPWTGSCGTDRGCNWNNRW